MLGGLTTEEIARAFLVPVPTVAARIVRAKRTLADARVPFEVPRGVALVDRLSSVLEVVYLVFNEGYAATGGDDWMRPALCEDALRLGRILAELVPQEPEVHGLVALMEIQASRSAARIGPGGQPVLLLDQDRARWDQLLIRRGLTALGRAEELGGARGPYAVQAAIAACHARARTPEETNWARIVVLYQVLAEVEPSPVVELNRAVAVGMAFGPAAGLALVDELSSDPALQGYHLLPSVRGDLLVKVGRLDEARSEFERAAALTSNARERTILLERAAACADASALGAEVTLAEAATAFLARDDLDAATVRSYGQTMNRLRRDLGDDLPVRGVNAEQVTEVFAAAWQSAAAATWNRHRGAVRSFSAWASERDWLSEDLAAGIGRRPEPRSRTRPMEPPRVEALWERPDLAPRERALWLMLHESAAGIGAVLSLNVEDLDLAGMRGRAAGARWIHWRSGTAELIPHLVAGRRRGPLFLSERRPGPGRRPAPGDLCPETGRRRLSYERAEYLFKQATGHTLNQLRGR